MTADAAHIIGAYRPDPSGPETRAVRAEETAKALAARLHQATQAMRRQEQELCELRLQAGVGNIGEAR